MSEAPEAPPPHRLLRYFGWIGVDNTVQQQAITNVRDEFQKLADWVDVNVPGGQEQTVALRKLLEAKESAVRALL